MQLLEVRFCHVLSVTPTPQYIFRESSYLKTLDSMQDAEEHIITILAVNNLRTRSSYTVGLESRADYYRLLRWIPFFELSMLVSEECLRDPCAHLDRIFSATHMPCLPSSSGPTMAATRSKKEFLLNPENVGTIPVSRAMGFKAQSEPCRDETMLRDFHAPSARAKPVGGRASSKRNPTP